MAKYGKSDRPQGNRSNRSKRDNAHQVNTGSSFTSGDHDKRRRPPGARQGEDRRRFQNTSRPTGGHRRDDPKGGQ